MEELLGGAPWRSSTEIDQNAAAEVVFQFRRTAMAHAPKSCNIAEINLSDLSVVAEVALLNRRTAMAPTPMYLQGQPQL